MIEWDWIKKYRKRTGFNTAPCRTPIDIGAGFVMKLFNFTVNERSLKNSYIHDKMYNGVWMFINLKSNPLGQTLSNVSAISKKYET